MSRQSPQSPASNSKKITYALSAPLPGLLQTLVLDFIDIWEKRISRTTSLFYWFFLFTTARLGIPGSDYCYLYTKILNLRWAKLL